MPHPSHSSVLGRWVKRAKTMMTESDSFRCARMSTCTVLLVSTILGCGSNVFIAPNSQNVQSQTDAKYLATLSIGTSVGYSISPTFMGLSHEWGVQNQMGDDQIGVDAVYRQMLSNLTANGSGPIMLRIGGNTTDTTSEPTASTVRAFAQLAEATGAHFDLGVNLGADNVNLAIDQARAFINQIPAGSLDAIEIGNEPDLYHQNGLRSTTYTFADYLLDFEKWKTGIRPLVPDGTPLMGASWASTYTLTSFKSYLEKETSALAVVSQHNYLGSVKDFPQPDVLLEPSMSTTPARAVAASVAAAHAVGLPFRMGEIGAFYDSTSKSANNTFQAALWAVDSMFEFANVGVDGVNWHGNPSVGALYTSFSIETIPANGRSTYQLYEVYPLYYGLLLFQQATGNLSHLLPVTLHTNANLKAWATIDASGKVRVVLLNKDEADSGTVSITAPHGFSHVEVTRLTAPAYSSMNGVTLGGQTFDGSKDGTLQGTASIETLSQTNGTFQLPLASVSAALIVFER